MLSRYSPPSYGDGYVYSSGAIAIGITVGLLPNIGMVGVAIRALLRAKGTFIEVYIRTFYNVIRKIQTTCIYIRLSIVSYLKKRPGDSLINYYFLVNWTVTWLIHNTVSYPWDIFWPCYILSMRQFNLHEQFRCFSGYFILANLRIKVGSHHEF